VNLINTIVLGDCYAETLIAIIIQDHLIENIVLGNAIKILNVGIITISFGIVLDQIYSNVITTLVRSAKESTLIHIEKSLQGLGSCNVII
jgi:hypothetical protein